MTFALGTYTRGGHRLVDDETGRLAHGAYWTAAVDHDDPPEGQRWQYLVALRVEDLRPGMRFLVAPLQKEWDVVASPLIHLVPDDTAYVVVPVKRDSPGGHGYLLQPRAAAYVVPDPQPTYGMIWGWLQACGWSTGDGDHRDGPFTDDARRAAFTSLAHLIALAGPEDVGTYLYQAAPVAQPHTPDEQFGHDAYLTQHGHGSGFWDRVWIEKGLGERLSAAARKVPEVYAFVNEAGEVDVE